MAIELIKSKYPKSAWEIDSKCVVFNLRGDGQILWPVGPDIILQLDGGCLGFLCDVGLEDAPEGVSIWEGKYACYPPEIYHTEDGTFVNWDNMSEAIGEFRLPTDQEWESIKKNECPWNEKELYGLIEEEQNKKR